MRGGGGGENDSVFTLLMRVFVPKFGRKNESNEGELDLEGGGLLRRLRRLMFKFLGKAPGISGDASTKGDRSLFLSLNLYILSTFLAAVDPVFYESQTVRIIFFLCQNTHFTSKPWFIIYFQLLCLASRVKKCVVHAELGSKSWHQLCSCA